uniref:Uncharacterized protein n=1 Tax=Anguilla anguilla TaxID=7936 RepID=A0A0E9QHM5_ANGAN
MENTCDSVPLLYGVCVFMGPA